MTQSVGAIHGGYRTRNMSDFWHRPLRVTPTSRGARHLPQRTSSSYTGLEKLSCSSCTKEDANIPGKIPAKAVLANGGKTTS